MTTCSRLYSYLNDGMLVCTYFLAYSWSKIRPDVLNLIYKCKGTVALNLFYNVLYFTLLDQLLYYHGPAMSRYRLCVKIMQSAIFTRNLKLFINLHFPMKYKLTIEFLIDETLEALNQCLRD